MWARGIASVDADSGQLAEDPPREHALYEMCGSLKYKEVWRRAQMTAIQPVPSHSET